MIAAAVLVLVGLFVWFAISLGGALLNPSLGSSVGARGAEWFREHGFSSVVNWVENEWYSHHAPPKGGRPPKGAIPPTPRSTTTTSPTQAVALPEPPPVTPQASPPLPGEGQWHPVGRMVDGVPAVYQAFVRPDAVHTSYVAGIAWMDTRLLKATLYSGSFIPGGGPYTHSAPITPQAASTLVAAFNAGFQMDAGNVGGYYTDNKTIIPLQNGLASFVIYKDGSVTIGSWGQQVTMSPDVVSVRQNLPLIVDNGKPVPGLNANDTSQWGATLGDQVYVWRSGVGETANGALVYVGGSGLNITDVANLLVAAGAVRGMELDINTDWVNFASYDPSTPDGQATPANGTDLLNSMTGQPDRYFQSDWTRDFFTMSAAPPGPHSPPPIAVPPDGASTTTVPKSNPPTARHK